MNTKKAYIKLDGEIGEKEQPAIEYIDSNYTAKKEKQQKEINDLLSKLDKNNKSKHKFKR